MFGWFGGTGQQKRKDAPKKAILDLRQQLDMLQKREKHLENQMSEQDAIARKNVSTNKTGEYYVRSSIPSAAQIMYPFRFEKSQLARFKSLIAPHSC